ncbi:MAG: GNAT family N-acetyltransferase [Luteolibacter sp.]
MKHQANSPALCVLALWRGWPRLGIMEVTDNTQERRFELVENGLLAFADYDIDGNVLVIPHVEAHPDLRGSGAAGRLMKGLLEIADERGMEIRPVCGYAAAYLRKHRR